jgi:hypothetical protein
MIRLLSLFSLCLLYMASANAQLQFHHCGTDHQADTEVKAKMLRNRQNIDPAVLQAAMANRNTRYIPTTLHLVGNENGAGFANAAEAVKMLCKLNTDFADQNIMFYLASPVNYIYDNTIYADAYDWGAQSIMGSYKVNNTLNIFVNGNTSRPVAGYYTPWQDFVFIQNGYANGTSTTITHELGHFFTLPHTFYGWEGVDARVDYNGQSVPTVINGAPVEYVVRSGGNANCNNAADGFCDTPADYISQRFFCPVTANVKDPAGDFIAPDASMYMSYASDACHAQFSQEQKNAMLADIISRGWNNFNAPGSLDTVSGANINSVSPLEASTVSPSGNTVRLEWDTTGANGSTLWLVTVERVFNNIPLGVVYSQSVSNQTFLDVPTSALGSNRQFRWNVKPMTPTYTCASYSNYFSFNTGIIASTETQNALNTGLNIFPNPNRTGVVKMKVESTKDQDASLKIYSFDGRLVYEQESIFLNAGSQILNLELGQLGTGNYMIVLTTEQTSLQGKLILVD